MDMVDLLKAFVATAQTGSFTDGAERLGISNRLTSKYVGELEARLGTRLFQRTTRKVGLTSTGQMLLVRAPVLLDSLDDLINSVTEDARGFSGTLRVSAPLTFGEIYFNDLLSRFALPHPDLTVDLRLSDAYVDLASAGIDVAFRVGPPEVSSLKVRRLGMLSSSIVAAPEYLDQCGIPTTAEELAAHKLIMDTNLRAGHQWLLKKGGADVVVRARSRFMVNSARVARDWAMAGYGITMCPDFVLMEALESGRLVRLLEDYAAPVNPVNAVYLEGAVLPRKVRALIDFAVEDIKKHCFLS